MNEPVQNDANKPTFETSLEQLQLIVKQLESGDLTLETALKSFEDGVRLTRLCQEHLTSAEQRIEILNQGSADGKPEFAPFAPQK